MYVLLHYEYVTLAPPVSQGLIFKNRCAYTYRILAEDFIFLDQFTYIAADSLYY